jgi:DNA polymerase-3 subunit gamma/tau
VVSTEPGTPTVASQNEAKRSELEQGVRADPLVQKVLARFPGAEIVGVRRREEIAHAPLPPVDPEEQSGETIIDDTPAFGERRAPDDVDDDF